MPGCKTLNDRKKQKRTTIDPAKNGREMAIVAIAPAAIGPTI